MVKRVIVFKERRVPIVDYLLEQNARKYHPTLMRMTASELREAKDREWKDRKRAWILEAIEKRLAQLQVAAEKLVILKNARRPTSTRGRLPLTPKQVEERITQLLQMPDTKRNRQQIYEATKLLRKKREAYLSNAMKRAALNEHKRLSAQQYKEFQRELGSHFCPGSGECALCGGQGLA